MLTTMPENPSHARASDGRPGDGRPGDGRLRPLSESLDRVVRQLGPDAAIVSVIKLWPEIVGEDIAEHCQPERLHTGTLLVGVTDSNWATELRYNGAYIIEKLAEQLAPDAIKRLEIRVIRNP